MEEVVTDVEDPGKGERISACVGDFFQGYGSDASPLWVQDVGADLLNQPDTGRVTVQGGIPDRGNTTAEVT